MAPFNQLRFSKKTSFCMSSIAVLALALALCLGLEELLRGE